MISVIIPLFNKQNLISQTINSVLNQTFQDFEIVIVNDGSTDESVSEVRKFQDSRIRLIMQENAGVSAARNKGIENAKGEFVALLDGDDKWKPTYLESLIKLSKNYPQCDIFAVNYELHDETGKITHTIIRKLPFNDEDGILSNYFEVASVSDPPICSISIMARKNIFTNIGGFPEGVTSGEDLITWAKLACHSKIAYYNKSLAIYYTPTTGPTGVVPKDLESTNDYVGSELQKLAVQFPDKGIKEYIAFWYKMRGAINIRRGNRIPALKCALKSIKFYPLQYKSWFIAFLSFMPRSIINKVMRK